MFYAGTRQFYHKSRFKHTSDSSEPFNSQTLCQNNVGGVEVCSSVAQDKEGDGKHLKVLVS